MPSKNPLIGVRLEPALFARVEAIAQAQGRSLANFVRHQLVLSLGAGVPASASTARQVDLVDSLATGIARQVKRGPVRRPVRRGR